MMQRVSAPPAPTPKAVASSFISNDPTTAAIVRRVEIAAARKMPILIRGETGTGKEQMARHAHAASRRTGSFVAVKLRSPSRQPDRSRTVRLFGGCFHRSKKGRLVGTVPGGGRRHPFLDEIGDMPVTLQAVLLRFWTTGLSGRWAAASARSTFSWSPPRTPILDDSIAKGRFQIRSLVSPEHAGGDTVAVTRAYRFRRDRAPPDAEDRPGRRIIPRSNRPSG